MPRVLRHVARMQALIDLEDLVARASGLRCPRCDGDELQRWGRTRGRLRYRCKSCRSTFNAHTRTAVAYRKRLDEWPLFLALMNVGATLREAAAACSIDLSTAFRWRHAVLAELRTREAPALTGEVELSDLHFALSDKGARQLGDGRKRGWDMYHVEHFYVPRIHVLVLRAQSGGVRTLQCGEEVTRAQLLLFLQAHHASGPSPDQRVLAHRNPFHRGTRDVDEYERRLRRWLRAFRGVATRYLSAYLAWHRHREGDVSIAITATDPWRVGNIDWHELPRARRALPER